MDLTVARAVFTGSLLSSEPGLPALRREDATIFAKTLLTAINICSKQNVKKCKDFIFRAILPSTKRTAAFLKFLLTISKTSAPSESKTSKGRERSVDESEGLDRVVNGKVMPHPDVIFRRVHTVYILHDLLAFTILKAKDPSHAEMKGINSAVIEQLQNAAVILARLAICNNGTPSFASKEASEIVENLLSTWQKHELLPIHMTSELHASLREAEDMEFSTLLETIGDEESQATLASQRAKEAATKWVIPATHHLPHDPTAPWHHLPAANGLYQKRTQGFPLQASSLPVGGYRLPNGGRRANETLQIEVEELLKEATHCFDKYTDAKDVQDIDPLGNIIWKSGTGRKRRNHWGWSYEGIESRRQRLT